MQINNENNGNNDNVAAIGIGAMIVFIALILVAAVASAVIIQTAEKLQQSAQSTGDDTTDEMSGKIQILNVFVDDPAESFVIYFRLAAGSDSTNPSDILWQVFCEDPDDGGVGVAGTDRLAGEFDDTAGAGGTSIVRELSDPAAAPAVVAAIDAGVAYRVSIDVNDADECSPTHLFTENVKGTLYIHVVGGGTTYDVLKVNDDTRGAVVV